MADRRSGDRLVGLAASGAMVVGTVGLIMAAFALLSGEFLAAGVSLVGSALAFGLLLNAMLRS